MGHIAGGCLCGKVRYTSEAAPVFTALCHCLHCQKQAGSAFGVVVALPKGSLVVEGTLATFDDAGSSGQPVYRRFCPHCGSPILSDVAAMPDLVFVKAGTLDDTSWLAPGMQIWCESAQPWVPQAPEIARFARMPTP